MNELSQLLVGSALSAMAYDNSIFKTTQRANSLFRIDTTDITLVDRPFTLEAEQAGFYADL